MDNKMIRLIIERMALDRDTEHTLCFTRGEWEQVVKEIEAIEKRVTMLERGYAAMYAMPFTPTYLHSQEAMRAFLREAYPDIAEMVERHTK